MSDQNDDSHSTDAQPTPADDHDQLQEAVARDRYTERVAHGTVDGADALLVARVTDYDAPVLETHAGGTTDLYPSDPELAPEHADGASLSRTFEYVEELDLAFDALVATHDLDTLDADGETTADKSATEGGAA